MCIRDRGQNSSIPSIQKMKTHRLCSLLDFTSIFGCVLNNVAYSKNCHNGSFEIMRCPSKKAPCGSMSCWFIYTPHHLYSILYIKVTIRGTLPKIDPFFPPILTHLLCNLSLIHIS